MSTHPERTAKGVEGRDDSECIELLHKNGKIPTRYSI